MLIVIYTLVKPDILIKYVLLIYEVKKLRSSIFVQDLGPLKNVSMDLSANFSMIIGPQASGKSTLGKIIYFCRKIRDYAADFIGEDEFFSGKSVEELYASFIRKIRRIFMETFDANEFVSTKFQVHYNYDKNDFVHMTLSEDGYINFDFSQVIEMKLKNIFEAVLNFNVKKLNESDGNTWNNAVFQRFWQQRAAIETKVEWFSDLFHDSAEILYIPAGRGILSILANQINSATALNFDIPVRDFVDRVLLAKARFRKGLDKVVEDYAQTEKDVFSKDDIKMAQVLIRTILKADYVSDADGEKLYIAPSQWIKLIYSSSGQQEALWILLFMFSLIMEHKRAFIILEEPEANVYPSAQKEIIKLVALTLNSTQSQIFITTHSPYIMTSANVLIHSGKVENSIPEIDDVIVPKPLRIDPQTTMAYKFSESKTGLKFVNIRDAETGMFDAFEIDSISDVIGEETDRLIDLEIKHDM